MSDITINYKGSSIATLDASGTKTLETSGKYCEDDIEVVYIKSGGGLGDFELLDTVTVSEAVSEVSLTIPSGYTQIGISYSVEMSASTKANFYHTSVAPSHLIDASSTGTSKSGAFVVHEIESCTVDGYAIGAKAVSQTSTDQASAPINEPSPLSTIVCACNTQGATINSGTFKIYGR